MASRKGQTGLALDYRVRDQLLAYKMEDESWDHFFVRILLLIKYETGELERPDESLDST